MRHLTKAIISVTGLTGLVVSPALAQDVYPDPADDAAV